MDVKFELPGLRQCACVVLFGLALSAYAAAQTEVPQGAASSSRTKASGKLIEEVYVSATKRESALQDTGIAISVLTAEDLKFRDMNNLEDFENAVPGLKVGTILGTPLINIRGVGLNFISGLGNPGVATHYDGVYIPRASSASLTTIDIGQVEVLRGPQGTLYGRNATGGSINFLSKRPATEFGAGLTFTAGDYDRRSYETYIEGPLTDRLAARAFFKHDSFEGYGINETTGKSIGDNTAVMGHVALTWQLTDALEVHAGYSTREDEGSYPYSTPLSTVTPLLGVSGMEYYTDEQTFKPRNTKALPENEPHSTKDGEIAHITVSWDFSDYTLKSITGYVGYERDAYMSAPEIERDLIHIRNGSQSDAWSQEFNFSGKLFDGAVNFLLGAYYTVDDGSTPYGARINLDEAVGLTVPTGQYLIFAPESLTKDISSAAFLDGYWSIRDTLRLVFGIRASEEHRELTQTFQPYIEDTATGLNLIPDLTQLLLSTNLTPIATCENEHNELDFSSVDPKLSIEWDFLEDAMVYLQYQTGFKAGGFESSTGCEETYDPEHITSFELGLKSTWLEGLLTVNAALFTYDYEDYQVDKIVGFESRIENAAEATTRGFELEATFSPSAWLTFDVQYSYLDARYDEYVSKDNFKNTHVLLADAPEEDLSGNHLSRAPQFTVNAGVNLFVPINRYGISLATLRLEGFASDEVWFREFNRPIEKQDAYETFNAFLTLTSTEDKVSLSVFGKNLTDEDYKTGIIPFDTVKYYGAYYAPPRTVGASISLKL